MSGPSSSGSLDDASASVGEVLANLRRRRGYTGKRLGELARMSQAKISKIETGAVLPSAADVTRLARALGIPADEAERLAERAENAQNQMTDWRFRRGGLAGGQIEVARMESTGTLIRSFQNGAISGLLQTAEYARAIYTALQPDDAGPEPVAQAVAARIERQQVLADPAKRFVFVMTESVLQYSVCQPAEMVGQIERLREASALDNVTIGFLPTTKPLTTLPFHHFHLVDDRLVEVDLLVTFLSSRGRSDVSLYSHLFETLEREAASDIDPILDRYLNIYLDLARPGREQRRG